MAAKKTTKKAPIEAPVMEPTPELPKDASRAQLEESQRARLRRRTNQQQKLANYYRSEKLVSVRFAPSYAAYLGKVVNISVNGIFTSIPCNGRSYELPESFAAEANRKRRSVDAYMMKMEQGADTESNFDGRGTPGVLRLN